MITFNEEQLSIISKLNPLSESKFLYNSAKWKNLNADYKDFIKEYEDKEISRQDIIDTYNEYYQDSSKGWMKSFLLTMVWGFADNGYGTYRTNNYISTEANRIHIKNAIDCIHINKNKSLANAFKELRMIKGLGISYLTKILYFATKATNKDSYALIFDKRVAASLIRLTTAKQIYSIVSVSPSSAFKDYEKFNELISETANYNKLEADQIEMYLFNQDPK